MKASKSMRLGAAVLTAASWTAFPATAQWAEMGTLDGNVCAARDVNDRGDAIGVCRDIRGDFLPVYWANRLPPVPLTPLELDGPCQAVALSNDGTVAGNCEQGAAGQRHPVRWNANSPRGEPQKLGLANVHIKAGATLVNNVGAVVGYGVTNSGGARAVIWRAGQTTPIPLPELGPLPPLLPTSAGCYATDVSDDQEPMISGVCSLRGGGTVGVRWSPTGIGYRVDELPRLPQGSNCETSAVNGRGQVAGTCQNHRGTLVAVRWNADLSSYTYLEHVQVESNVQQLWAASMNELGVVAGHYADNRGLLRSFVWTPGGNPATEQGQDLGSLGGHWTRALAIGDNGAIVGNAQDGNGATRGFRWTLAGIANLGTLSGGLGSTAEAISDAGGFIVGTSQTALGATHAVGRPATARAAAIGTGAAGTQRSLAGSSGGGSTPYVVRGNDLPPYQAQAPYTKNDHGCSGLRCLFDLYAAQGGTAGNGF